ncbi:MAG: carbohydrate ABC transporter permease [Ruminococcaceae bacterium]|nr:carbohydrate ABC transporter permease [Oscillospiraceae bacterium]
MDNSTPKITKESKNKIKVEFDRTPLKERLKAKFLNFYFFQTVVIKIFRFIFLLGIAYIVLFPFFSKIAGSFMAPEDFIDVTVRLVPKNFTLDIYKAIWTDLDYVEALINTTLISLLLALLQTFTCCVIAYGLAKYKFKGNGLIFMLVMVTMIIPHKTLQSSMSMNFTYFDIANILSTLSGGTIVDIDFFGLFQFTLDSPLSILNLPENSINLKNTIWPFIILSVTGLAFKNGLYIFMLRQFFRGIPDSLEESAYIDGSGDFRTFLQIILPMSVPMMITVFLFSFCWQWTDTFYTSMFFTNMKEAPMMLSQIIGIPKSLDTEYAGQTLYETAIRNTCGIMIIAPLVVLYVFLQRYLVEGIERSGLTAE